MSNLLPDVLHFSSNKAEQAALHRFLLIHSVLFQQMYREQTAHVYPFSSIPVWSSEDLNNKPDEALEALLSMLERDGEKARNEYMLHIDTLRTVNE